MASEKEGKKEDLVLSHGLRGEVIRKATVQLLPEERQLWADNRLLDLMTTGKITFIGKACGNVASVSEMVP